VIPLAFLNPPQYTRGAPGYVNYATIALTIAHEILHALDGSGTVWLCAHKIKHLYTYLVRDQWDGRRKLCELIYTSPCFHWCREWVRRGRCATGLVERRLQGLFAGEEFLRSEAVFRAVPKTRAFLWEASSYSGESELPSAP
jgi:hypothetical protein